MNNFIWSQTALKELEKESTCPFKWYSQWVLQLFPGESKPVFDLGHYFEYLCIGKNAKSDAVVDLPRTTTGAKTAVHKRIESQAEKFKAMVDPLHSLYVGFEIDAVQLRVEGTINGIPVGGDIDFIGKEKNGSKRIVDLKLTSDAYSTYTQYGWGNDLEDLDLIQQVLYTELYRQQYGELLPTTLMIFEYGIETRTRVIDLEISENKFIECIERFTAADNVVNLYQKHGWTKCPSLDECKTCGVKDCALRVKPAPYVKEKFIY